MKKKIIFLIILLCPTLSYASNCAWWTLYNNPDADINVTYCNLGGYAIEKMWLYLYNQEGEELIKKVNNPSLTLFNFKQYAIDVPFPDENKNGIDDNGWYKLRLKYKIEHGEKHSCIIYFKRKKHRPNIDIDWRVYSEGTIIKNNKCKTQRLDINHSKVD